MAKTKKDAALELAAREELRKKLRDGETLYTIFKSVNRDGDSRVLSVVHVTTGGEIECLDWLIARAGIYPSTPQGNIRVRGVGMDMGWDCVYTISRLALGNDSLKQQWL